MPNVPEDLKYSEDHEWIKVENGDARIGITDFAQEELGDIVYVELPEVGEEIEMGDMLGVVESVKTVSDVYSPLSGEIVEVNEELEESPEIINEDPYGDGWIAVIKISDRSELNSLNSPEDYKLLMD
ncbi:MAG: glycine cleavage system protein GcvH [Thermoplasmata archaeon]